MEKRRTGWEEGVEESKTKIGGKKTNIEVQIRGRERKCDKVKKESERQEREIRKETKERARNEAKGLTLSSPRRCKHLEYRVLYPVVKGLQLL